MSQEYFFETGEMADVRHPYDGSRVPVLYVQEEDGLTHQSMRDECDINNLLSHYLKGAPLPPPVAPGQYLDVSNVTNYHDAMLTVQEAREHFEQVPSAVRELFNHDAVAFLDAFNDPTQHDMLREHGLLAPLPAVEPDPVPQDPPQSEEP